MTIPLDTLEQRQVAAGEEVRMGSLVEIEDDGGERLTVRIAHHAETDPQAISPDSPVACALIGASRGEQVVVEAPRGSWTARVLSVS